MILYPTETIYALGVNPFNEAELQNLYILKGRTPEKAVSWLVRTVDDINYYAEMSHAAVTIASLFLPGPLTLVLPLREEHRRGWLPLNIGFRVTTDPVAMKIIAAHTETSGAPLTCTSANVSGQPTGTSTSEILTQFGDLRTMIDSVYDDGPRQGLPSTVIHVAGEEILCLREGAIPFIDILQTRGD